ncbi:MAG: hypothetical protein AAGD86_08265 [Pseudomonadota bacterium]
MTGAVDASAPGKLVLTGEYAVLDGAPAVSMAISRRAIVRVEPASDFCVRAPGFLSGSVRFAVDADGRLRWLAGDPDVRRRLALVDRVVAPLLAGRAPAPFALRLDTRAFFAADGRKLGLGSSAALTAALSAALTRHLGLPAQTPDAFLAAALERHRRVQGGRGSGVDLATSLHGGVIEYTLERAAPASRRPGFQLSKEY